MDVKEYLEKAEKTRLEIQNYQKQKVAVKMVMNIEGFKSEIDTFEFDSHFKIRRSTIEERSKFYSRASSFQRTELKIQDNQFFIEYDYQLQRGLLMGIEPSEAIDIVSIFFAVCGDYSLNINQGNFYVDSENGFASSGFYSLPNELRFPTHIEHRLDNLNALKKLWPAFKLQFESNSRFALLARRFFYSILRVSLEDRLIDLFIAVEALLIYEKNGSKGDKIAERLSKLLANQYNRDSVYELSESMYKARNEVIHGTNTIDNRRGSVDQLIAFTRAAIQEYLLNFAGLDAKSLVKSLEDRG